MNFAEEPPKPAEMQAISRNNRGRAQSGST